MILKSLGLAGLLALSMLAASPARAAVTLPSIETIETRLCPVGGATALRAGLPKDAQDAKLREAFSSTGEAVPPFGESRAIYTQWSEKLSAIEFLGASPDGDDNRAFLSGMTARLKASGWIQVDAKAPGSLFMEPSTFEKVLSTADGPRPMVLEIEASGNVGLRCGDAELIRLSEDEGLELLAPDSLRPVMPASPASLGSMRKEDCARPEFREGLLKTLNAGNRPELTGSMDRAMALEDYHRRLRTWLRWKIAASGKIDFDALWAIEEKIAPMSGDQIEQEFGDLATSIVAVDAPRKKGDAEGECRAMVGMVSGMTNGSSAEVDRLAKVNAALEAEGRRLGVALD